MRWQDMIFPDNSESLRASILKPRGATPEVLCKRRIRSMGTMMGLLFVRAYSVASNKGGLFYQFTHWTFTSMWVAYTTLSIAHIFNNDMKKKFYEKPDRIDDTIMPYRVCYAAIIMYEWSYIAAATIMIAYSALEYPFSNIDGTWELEGRAWYIDLLGHVIHVAPYGIAIWEYSISSIRIELYRVPLYVILLIFYTLVNVGEGEIRGI